MNRKNNVFQRYFQNEEKAVNGKVFMEIIMKKISQIISVSLAVLILTFLLGCPAPNKEEAKVTGIVVSLTGATFIEKDKTVTLTVEVKGTGDYDKVVTWKSDKEAIATVKDGVVTGKAAGKATITATSVADTAISGTLEVEVKENYVDTVTIDGGNIGLNVNQKKVLIAKVTRVGTVADADMVLASGVATNPISPL